jgi:hypothetical protein
MDQSPKPCRIALGGLGLAALGAKVDDKAAKAQGAKPAKGK